MPVFADSFILGDAAAALIGKSLGRISIGKKQWKVQLDALLLVSSLPILHFHSFQTFWKNGEGNVFFQACVVGLSISLLELFPAKIGRFKLNDNLYVPVLVTYIAFFIC